MQRDAVPYTQELARVLSIPRTPWDEQHAGELAASITNLIRLPRGSMALRPVQAVSLKSAWEQQGFFGPIGVGRGKTLLSLLLAYVLQSERPLLVLPANLIGKTRKEWIELACHWPIPNWIRLISYELCGRVQAKDEIELFQPDLIIFDEVQKVKNRKAAVTKRFDRYIKARRAAEAARGATHPHAPGRLRVCAMSGTITSKSLKDFAHIVQWCLPHFSPVPGSWHELENWANALDELVNPLRQIDPGALLMLCDARENDAPDPRTAARRGFARRLAETPGVVATTDGHIAASILVEELEHPASDAIEDAFDRLRGCEAKNYKGWELPDGKECIDGPEIWRHARELALGFFYVWDPWPPAEWVQARGCWATFARGIIKRGRLDSEADVMLHAHEFECTVDQARELRGWLPHENPEIGRRHVADHWRAVRDTFKPNKRAVWICDSVLRMCSQWLRNHPRGIVWSGHTAFGEALERVSGFPYFGAEGLDRGGRMIEQATGPVIASLKANKEGRNLQYNWSDNLIMSCPGDGLEAEQLLGRTHRDGQTEDTVTFKIFNGCIEHISAFWTALGRAVYMQDTTRNAQKLVYADKVMPSIDEIVFRPGARWRKWRS